MNVINKTSLEGQRSNGSLISLSRWNESTTIYSSTLVPCHKRCGYRETNNFLFLVPSPKIILGRRRRRRLLILLFLLLLRKE